jgi:sarcosine oxidase
MSGTHWDVIVVGVGAMGAATCRELARRGHRVLGLEQFRLGHSRGSSHGQTRVIRTAYYEHPVYVPMVQRAFELWYDLEQQTGVKLLTECPCLNIGRRDSELITGVRRAASEHRLLVEELSAAEFSRRFPPFQFDQGYCGIFERQAGFLDVEACVRALIRAARRLGAIILSEVQVAAWRVTSTGVEVETSIGKLTADRLVLTAGPWTRSLLQQLNCPLTVMRQTLLWFGTRDDRIFRRDRFPIYLAETPAGAFYGLPVINAFGHKVARHYGTTEVDGPEAVERSVSPDDVQPVQSFLAAHLPAVDGPCRFAQVCMYTLTPDRHFILDLHPQHSQVAIAAGFSGHGFKFTPVIGQIMADLAANGRTDWPTEMFRMLRFRLN